MDGDTVLGGVEDGRRDVLAVGIVLDDAVGVIVLMEEETAVGDSVGILVGEIDESDVGTTLLGDKLGDKLGLLVGLPLGTFNGF